MTAPTVTDLPEAPSRVDPTNFAVRADLFLAALPQFQTELNALADYLETEVPAEAASQAETFANQAQTYAESSGDVKFYDTYADANTALGGLSEGQVVEVYRDETKDNRRTRYRVESSALVFKIYFFGEIDTTAFPYLEQTKSESYWIERNLVKNRTIPAVKPSLSLDFTEPSKSEAKGVSLEKEVSGFKNKIINGNFDIWQRATSQTTAGYGSDDRWFNIHIGSSKTHQIESFSLGQTEVPGNPVFFSRTIVTSSVGASNYTLKAQRIEDVRTLSGKKAVLSFYAKADSAKNIAIELTQVFGTGGSPSSEVSGIGSQKVALTTQWTKFEVVINIPSITGKTLGTNADHHLQLVFWFEAGSSFDSRTESLGQQSGTFDIAQVQLEEGEVATSFEQRSYQEELVLCERYYKFIHATGTTMSNTEAVVYSDLRPAMRAVPVWEPSGLTLNIEGFGTPSGLALSNTINTNIQILRAKYTYSATASNGYPCTIVGHVSAEL